MFAVAHLHLIEFTISQRCLWDRTPKTLSSMSVPLFFGKVLRTTITWHSTTRHMQVDDVKRNCRCFWYSPEQHFHISQWDFRLRLNVGVCTPNDNFLSLFTGEFNHVHLIPTYFWLISAYLILLWATCDFIMLKHGITDEHIMLLRLRPGIHASHTIIPVHANFWFTKWTRHKFHYICLI